MEITLNSYQQKALTRVLTAVDGTLFFISDEIESNGFHRVYVHKAISLDSDGSLIPEGVWERSLSLPTTVDTALDFYLEKARTEPVDSAYFTCKAELAKGASASRDEMSLMMSNQHSTVETSEEDLELEASGDYPKLPPFLVKSVLSGPYVLSGDWFLLAKSKDGTKSNVFTCSGASKWDPLYSAQKNEYRPHEDSEHYDSYLENE